MFTVTVRHYRAPHTVAVYRCADQEEMATLVCGLRGFPWVAAITVVPGG